MDMGAARAPTIQRSEPCRRSRQSVWISRRRPGCYTPPIEATLRPGVLSEAAAVSGRHGGLWLFAPLVTRASGTWPCRAADATSLRCTDPSLQRMPGRPGDVRFSNRPFGVKHFQTIHQCGVDVARGLVLLFGIGTKALPSWDSRTRWSDLWGGLAVMNGRSKRTCELTSSIVPRGTSFHRSVEL